MGRRKREGKRGCSFQDNVFCQPGFSQTFDTMVRDRERNLRLLCLSGDDWSEVDSLQRGSALKAMGACEAHQAETPGCSFPSRLIRGLLLLLPDVFSLNLFSCLCTAVIGWDSWDSWPCKPDCSFWLWCGPSGHFTVALGLCAEPFIRVAGLSHHGGLGVWSVLQQVKRQRLSTDREYVQTTGKLVATEWPLTRPEAHKDNSTVLSVIKQGTGQDSGLLANTKHHYLLYLLNSNKLWLRKCPKTKSHKYTWSYLDSNHIFNSLPM